MALMFSATGLSQRVSTWVVAAALLTAVLSIPCLFVPISNVDEAFTAVTANVILQGGVPYRDSVDHRGPVTYFVYALVFLIAGKNNMLAVHAALIGVKVILVLLIAALGSRVLTPRGVPFALLLFAAMSTVGFTRIDLDAFHTEWVLILFSCLGSLFFIHGLLQGRLAAGLLAGLSFGMAFFTKQPAALDLLAALGFLLILALVRPQGFALSSPVRLLSYGMLIAVGFLMVAGAVAAYFSRHDAWSDFVFYFWTYNREYYIAAMPKSDFQMGLLRSFETATVPFGLGALAAVGGIAAWLQVRGQFGSEPSARHWLMLYVTLWGAGSLIGSMLSARGYPHYFIQILPAWCLLSGEAFEALAAALLDGQPEGARRRGQLILTALVGTLVVVLGLPTLLRETAHGLQRLRGLPTESPQDRLVAFLRRESADPIFVWGANPEIYILADRDPASRFSYCTFVMGLVPDANIAGKEDTTAWAVPGSLEILVQELRRNRPRFLIDSSPSNRYGFGRYPLQQVPPLAQLLREDYTLDQTFAADGVGSIWYRVYRRQSE